MVRASNAFLGSVLTLSLGASACGGNLASELAKPPTFAPKGESKCGVVKSQAEPLIVEWPDAARGKLESKVRHGLVAVRYAGCEMQVLDQCSVDGGRYAYASVNPKKSRVTMRDEDDLYANIPAYAVKFAANLQRAGQLNVDMTIVGRYDADKATVRAADLRGDCSGATHVVTGLSVGAFEFFSGADASVGAGVTVGPLPNGPGAHAGSTSKRETLNTDGEEAACAKAGPSDAAPPYGCGALLRLEVRQIEGMTPEPAPIAVQAPADAPVPTPGTDGAPPPPPSSPAASGDRFQITPSKLALHDAQSGLTWLRQPATATFWDAQAACGATHVVGSAPAPSVVRSLLAQDAAPTRSPEGWRLPTRTEIRKFFAATPWRYVGYTAETCFWVDDAVWSLRTEGRWLGQMPTGQTCVRQNGDVAISGDRAAYLCVKGQ